MKPQIYALIAAAAWGVGGYFEKRGLLLGGLTPHIGITLRTGVALVLLAAISAPHWRTVIDAGTKPLLHVMIGGGLVAGTIGMLAFYAALKTGSVTQVMPIAFTSPLFGVALALILGGEPLQARTLVGAALTVGGIALLSS